MTTKSVIKELTMAPLSGVITSMLTPFTESFSLNEETLAQELE